MSYIVHLRAGSPGGGDRARGRLPRDSASGCAGSQSRILGTRAVTRRAGALVSRRWGFGSRCRRCSAPRPHRHSARSPTSRTSSASRRAIWAWAERRVAAEEPTRHGPAVSRHVGEQNSALRRSVAPDLRRLPRRYSPAPPRDESGACREVRGAADLAGSVLIAAIGRSRLYGCGGDDDVRHPRFRPDPPTEAAVEYGCPDDPRCHLRQRMDDRDGSRAAPRAEHLGRMVA